MTTDMTDPETVRNRAKRFLAWGTLPFLAVNLVAAMLAGNPVLAVSVASLAWSLIALMGNRTSGSLGRMMVAAGLVGQPMVLTAALAGHPWQVDSHMLFFALLATTMAMSDVRAILLASAAIAVHHLVQTFFFPLLVYPSVDLIENVGRTVMHAVIVVIETAALCGAVWMQNRLSKNAEAARQEALSALDEARGASDIAERSRAEAESARQMAEAATEEASAEREATEAEAEKARISHQRARDLEERERRALARATEAQASVVAILGEALNKLANRDLTARVAEPLSNEHESLRRDLNGAIEALDLAISRVSQATSQLDVQSRRVSEGNSALSKQSERQSTTLRTATDLVAELAEGVRNTADRAAIADEIVTESRGVAEDADMIVQKARTAMVNIQDSANSISQTVSRIEEIAFQTNLLSLNAGIEAARAGAAGKGFAIVASEVGALARRSASAAKEIADLAGQSVAQVTDGFSLVEETSTALQNIGARVEDGRKAVTEISKKAAEQAEQLAVVDTAMQKLDQMTSDGQKVVVQTINTTSQLLVSVENLQEVTASFTTSSGQGFQKGEDRQSVPALSA